MVVQCKYRRYADINSFFCELRLSCYTFYIYLKVYTLFHYGYDHALLQSHIVTVPLYIMYIICFHLITGVNCSKQCNWYIVSIASHTYATIPYINKKIWLLSSETCSQVKHPFILNVYKNCYSSASMAIPTHRFFFNNLIEQCTTWGLALKFTNPSQ